MPVYTDVFLINEIHALQQDGAWPTTAYVAIPPDQEFGWFGAGYGPGGPISTVNRIDYASDAVTANTRGSLNHVAFAGMATGNQIYGWFTNGSTPINTLNRITYASDTGLASERGSLSFGKFKAGATGNTNYGWFGAGRPNPAPTPVSSVDRLDYAIDTATASARGPLTSARYDLAATGNGNFGWFGGGVNSSIVDRITYTIDTATASLRGPLNRNAQRVAATGNNDYGWFGGGSWPPQSTVDRIDYANDTGTTTIRGPLSLAVLGLAATGSTTFGWFGGGYAASLPGSVYVSTVNRINYAADTVNAITRGSLTTQSDYLSATGGFPG